MSTEEQWYAERLKRLQSRRWKQLLRVQAPYQWNLRRQHLGRTIDVGCGVGRNLSTLGPGALGVDHNEASVAEARAQGFNAVTVDEFRASPPERDSFDSLLFAHIIEHMTAPQAASLVSEYLPFLRPGGKVFMICPQERGYASDSTHVEFADADDLVRLAQRVGLDPEKPRSFPLPRVAGPYFIYNETTLLALKP